MFRASPWILAALLGGGSTRSFGDRASQPAWQRRFGATARLALEQRVYARIRVDRRCVILHQAARVSRRPVVAVHVASQHAQHRHLLASMMRRVSQPARHHPRSRSRHVEERRTRFPPRVVRLTKTRETTAAVFGVALDELHADFATGQWRRADVDPEHDTKPRVLAHALMHHLFEHAASSRIIESWTDGEILVAKLAPDTED